MKLTGYSWIAGQWACDVSKKFVAENPANSEQLEPVFYEASEQEIAVAMDAAAKASLTFRKTEASLRSRLLKEFAQQITLAKETLMERAHLETGLSHTKLEAEWRRVIWQAQIFAEMIEEGEWQRPILNLADPNRVGLPKPDVRQVLAPLGPVVVFGASNFPLAISVGGTDTVSALAAGCPVVVKAHPAHPGTSELVAQCMIKAVESCSMPPGVFSMIQGASLEVGAALVSHPQTAAVAFTGSLRGGRALFDIASRRRIPIPFYGELGSINPVFVLPEKLSKDYEAFAQAFVQSLTMGVGQYCTNPGIVVLSNRNGVDELYTHLKEIISTVPAQTMLHKGIYAAFERGIQGWRNTEGVHLVAEGLFSCNPDGNEAVTQVYATTYENFMRFEGLREEVFGPASLFVVCDNEEEILSLAQSLDGQLTASIHGTAQDLANADALVSILEQKVGRLIFDGFGTGIEVCEAMHHGGPYPSTTHPSYTSIGHQSIYRFVRPVAYQNAPQHLLPQSLQSANPLIIRRRVDGEWKDSEL